VPNSEFPLSEPGPYYPGKQEVTIVDENRNGREIGLTITYPAEEETDALSMWDAPAHKGDAPFPLILTGSATGDTFDNHLATHGFVMVEVEPPDSFVNYDFWVTDHPRDFLFALDQLASNPPKSLRGIIDTDHVGVGGYSVDGFYSLAVSGVRIDPQFYLERCRGASAMDPPLPDRLNSYYCDLAAKWEEFEAHASSKITESDDGLWQPLTDERIRAVAPMAPDGSWLYGERGLAAGDKPTLILAGTEDEFDGQNLYDMESVYIFEHLGSPDRTLVSFVDQTHFMLEKREQVNRMLHFVTAFFGYYLHGREDFADYFSEEYVALYNDLTWGVYEK
jgi:predicted dienelactone hydrolase